jgi:hypothetical protein
MWIVITLIVVAAVIDLAIICMVHNASDGGGEE